MGVFDQACKVGCAVPASTADHALAQSGALSYGAVNAEAALAGTVGTDCKLVNGNRWQQINGSMIENYAENVTSKIGQNQNHTVLNNSTVLVSGNHNETVSGQRTDLVVGPHNHTNVGVRNNTYVNPKTKVHSGD